MSAPTSRDSLSPSNHDHSIAELEDREPITRRFEQEFSGNLLRLPPSQIGIDDITIASRIPELTEPVQGMLPMESVGGRPDRWWTTRANGALCITHCPAAQLVTVRISVPRWLRVAPHNYPLHPITGVDALRPKDIARELALALSSRVTFVGSCLEQRLPIRIWPVLRVAYACDLHVADPLATLAGCRALRRRHQGRVQTFGFPTSTLQWASKHLRVQLYAKAVELENRQRTTLPEERPALNRLVEHARHVLRFEVTLLGVRAVRNLLWVEDGRLPTLQLMCDPPIACLAVSRQVDRLRLRETGDAPSAASLGTRARQLRAHLQHEFAYPSGRLLRTKKLTQPRLERLVLVYFLACGHRPAEVASFLGLSGSAVSDALRDLEALGLQPDGSSEGNLGDAVREVLEQLEPHLLDSFPELDHWAGRTTLVGAPWAHDEADDIDGVMDIDDEEELRVLIGGTDVG